VRWLRPQATVIALAGVSLARPYGEAGASPHVIVGCRQE